MSYLGGYLGLLTVEVEGDGDEVGSSTLVATPSTIGVVVRQNVAALVLARVYQQFKGTGEG